MQNAVMWISDHKFKFKTELDMNKNLSGALQIFQVTLMWFAEF